MPINKTISQEIKAVSFAIEYISAQVRNVVGSSEGQISRREEMKDTVIALRSNLTRLQTLEGSKPKVEQSFIF